VPIQGIKPGDKKRFAPAKRSLCFIGKLSPHGSENRSRWLKSGYDLSRLRACMEDQDVANGPVLGPCLALGPNRYRSFERHHPSKQGLRAA
jgi:hypothetical protein